MTPEAGSQRPPAHPIADWADRVTRDVLACFGDKSEADKVGEIVRVAMALSAPPNATAAELVEDGIRYTCMGNAMHIAAQLQSQGEGEGAKEWAVWFRNAGHVLLNKAISRFDLAAQAGDSENRKAH